MNVNRYQFDSIVSKTKKTITPIIRGEEDGEYFEYLAIVEILLSRFHKNFGINGRQAKEIIQLVLYDIKGVADGVEYDCSKWTEECYYICADIIEQCILPEKNPKLKAQLKDDVVLDDDYFEFARAVLIRIHESVTLWTNENGSQGYFNFISGFLGIEILTTKEFLVEDYYLK